MQKFKDSRQREWKIEINGWSVKRVKEETGVFLPTLPENHTAFLDLLNNVPALANVLYVLVEDQAKERKIDDRDFCTAMDGDAFEQAINALQEGLIEFLPKSRRATMHRIKEKGREMVALSEKKRQEKIEQLDVNKMVEDAMRLAESALSGKPSGNSPGSSASSPGDSPSGNSATWPEGSPSGNGSTPATSWRSSTTGDSEPSGPSAPTSLTPP